MNALFEFLFKYRPIVYERGTIAFRPFWPWWVSLLAAVAVVAGAWWIYRRSFSVLPVGWRYGLVSLRAATMLLVLAIFLQPVLVVHTALPQKSFVAIAYDTTKSMEIRDGKEGESRLEAVAQILRPTGNPLLEGLERKFKLRYFRFASGAARASGYEDAGRHGNVTDIERTLSQVVSELGSAPISGIVLVTDGADNHSSDLTAAASQLRARNIPVYTVGIGSPDVTRDTEAARVSAPKKVLKDAMIEAEIAVRSSGYAGRRARLNVKERDRMVHTTEITLGSDGEVRTYKVNFSSESPGAKVFTFRVEPFDDELIKENNQVDVLLRVEDVKPQVLYVEGEPRWEYGFLRRSVGEDKNLHLVTLLRQADGKFFRQGVDDPATLEKGFPSAKPDLYRYKALILGSVEASFFTFDQLRMISDFVSQRGGSFLMLGGKNALGQGGYINTPLEDVLPVNMRMGQGAPQPYQDIEYKLRLTGYGAEHPITRLAVAEEENRKRWAAAPSLVGLNPTSGAKPGATVLAQVSGPELRGQSPVVLAFQRFGRGKAVVLATASTWHWRMELDHRDRTHELFWKQMLRWLVSDVSDPVNAATEKHSSSLEETVRIRADVSDPSYVRVNNAEVIAAVKAPSGETTTVPLSWDVNHEGEYTGSFRPEEEGIHEVGVSAGQGGRTLGAAKANFRVAESTDEFHNAALNTQLLKRLAEETGGRHYTPADLRTLPEDVSFVNNGASRLEEKDLWDMPLLFLLLVGTASGEWVLRKKKGLA